MSKDKLVVRFFVCFCNILTLIEVYLLLVRVSWVSVLFMVGVFMCKYLENKLVDKYYKEYFDEYIYLNNWRKRLLTFVFIFAICKRVLRLILMSIGLVFV